MCGASIPGLRLGDEEIAALQSTIEAMLEHLFLVTVQELKGLTDEGSGVAMRLHIVTVVGGGLAS